jgi:hypothetical protein
MRAAWLLVAALVCTGCVSPDAAPAPPAPPGASLLPPSVVVDRAVGRDALQVYVHAKQGNVRYAHLNLSVDNATMEQRAGAYALDVVLDRTEAHLVVEVVDGDVPYRWAARVALNLTEEPRTLLVAAHDPGDGYARERAHALPYEKLLPREER